MRRKKTISDVCLLQGLAIVGIERIAAIMIVIITNNQLVKFIKLQALKQ